MTFFIVNDYIFQQLATVEKKTFSSTRLLDKKFSWPFVSICLFTVFVSDTGLAGWICTLHMAAEQRTDILVPGLILTRPSFYKQFLMWHYRSPVPLDMGQPVPSFNLGAHLL